MKYFLILFFSFCGFVNAQSSNELGVWSFSKKELPVYQYLGKLPFGLKEKNGTKTNLPNDPYFLLGNYRMKLITHASGIYQFLTGERVWSRINGTEQPNYGWNEASITFNNQNKLVLTGLKSIATDNQKVKKYFGVGFARYEYSLENNINFTRIISVKPSEKINTGNPSFVVTVVLKNNGKKTQELIYSEAMLLNFGMNGTQYLKKVDQPLTYSSNAEFDVNKQIALAKFSCKTNKFLTLPQKEERFAYEIDPPSVFMAISNDAGKISSSVNVKNKVLSSEIKTSVKSGETKTFHITIGIADGTTVQEVQNEVDNLFTHADKNSMNEGLFAKHWKTILPDLSTEKDAVLKREMLWNAHMVEALATYSKYYQETFIPQGTVYTFHFGDNISNRDHLQAALPACYTNPELAKSSIRYVIKHSEVDGEIKRGNLGYGYYPPSLYKESDEQLYFFNTISEYLLITKDYDFLNENVAYFPAEYGKKDLVINILKKYFIYLRDEVGRGPNGLVRMLNSDWSDSFFHDYSPNIYSGSAESHLNSAMVLAVFPKLINVLKQSENKEASSFVTALEEYRSTIEISFMKDLGNRKFAARAYLNNELRFGEKVVCIEPQSYLLQIPNLPIERKQEIYEYVKSKIITPEKIGARTREKPIWKGNPDGEDGGIWFSLEYPLLLGVATFDKKEAKSLLKKFSFQNYSEQYPDYWVGQWTAADEVNSTLYREGLYAFWVSAPDFSQVFQGFCSHPHTWPLYCYYKLKE